MTKWKKQTRFIHILAVLRTRIRDLMPFWPLNPGCGLGKNQDPDSASDSGMNKGIIFLKARNKFFGLKILKFFDADPDSGSFWPWIRDGNIRIRDNSPDPQHWILVTDATQTVVVTPFPKDLRHLRYYECSNHGGGNFIPSHLYIPEGSTSSSRLSFPAVTSHSPEVKVTKIILTKCYNFR